jgi:LTR polyprotein gag-polypeptide-like protein
MLTLQDLWEVVDGTFPRPSHTAPLVTCIEWTTKNCEAHMQIVLTLKDEPLDTIIDTDTAEECWERLLKRYEGKGTQRKMQLFKEIFKSAFTNTDPLEPQINSLLCLVHAVKNLG